MGPSRHPAACGLINGAVFPAITNPGEWSGGHFKGVGLCC